MEGSWDDGSCCGETRNQRSGDPEVLQCQGDHMMQEGLGVVGDVGQRRIEEVHNRESPFWTDSSVSLVPSIIVEFYTGVIKFWY